MKTLIFLGGVIVGAVSAWALILWVLSDPEGFIRMPEGLNG